MRNIETEGVSEIWWRSISIYSSPTCESSEHRFLTLLLAYVKLRKPLKPKSVKLHSYHEELTFQNTEAIFKGKMERTAYNNNQPYYFGTRIGLVITGELTGTLIGYSRHTNFLAPIVISLRPIIPDTEKILTATEQDITYYSKKKDPSYPHLTELLEEGKRRIISQGYITALLQLLEELRIEVDSDQLIRNSRVFM